MSADFSRPGTGTDVKMSSIDSVNSALVEDFLTVLKEIRENLESWKNTEAFMLPDKTAHIKNILEISDIPKSYRTQLSVLLETLQQIHDKLSPIKNAELKSLFDNVVDAQSRLKHLAQDELSSTKLSPLFQMLDRINRLLEGLRIRELAPLLSAVDQIKERAVKNLDLSAITQQLRKFDETIGSVDKSELLSLPKKFNAIVAGIEALAKKPRWIRLPKFTGISAVVTTLIVPGIGAVGLIVAALLNSRGNVEAKKVEVLGPIPFTQTAAVIQTLAATANPISQTPEASAGIAVSTDVTVSFTNPSSRATVRVILLKDGATFDTFEISHGKTELRKIPPGKYDLEAQIDYPAMTPSSPGCYIQWQQTTLYTGNLVIGVDTTTVNVKQFYFEPTEICTNQTPGP